MHIIKYFGVIICNVKSKLMVDKNNDKILLIVIQAARKVQIMQNA